MRRLLAAIRAPLRALSGRDAVAVLLLLVGVTAATFGGFLVSARVGCFVLGGLTLGIGLLLAFGEGGEA